jgi:large subunit ribosomal protein L16
MFTPKKVKYRKMHKLRAAQFRTASTKTGLAFGSVGLKALDPAWITSRQLEAARRAMTRFVKRGGKIWIRVFPDKSVTNHGNESVMGGGKGAVDYYVAIVRRGTILFEMDGVADETAREALRLASHKLPTRTKIVTKDQVV